MKKMATRHVRRRGGGLSIKRRWSAAKKFARKHKKTALNLGTLAGTAGLAYYGRKKSRELVDDLWKNTATRPERINPHTNMPDWMMPLFRFPIKK